MSYVCWIRVTVTGLWLLYYGYRIAVTGLWLPGCGYSSRTPMVTDGNQRVKTNRCMYVCFIIHRIVVHLNNISWSIFIQIWLANSSIGINACNLCRPEQIDGRGRAMPESPTLLECGWARCWSNGLGSSRSSCFSTGGNILLNERAAEIAKFVS